MHIARYNLVEAKARLEAQTGDELSWREVAEGLGVTANTVSNLKNSAVLKIDLQTVDNILSYFRARGVELTFYDLVTIEDVSEGEALKGEPASEALTSPVAA